MAILTGNGATERRAGLIEIASDAEAFAGVDVDHAITPDQLLAVVGQGVAAVAGGLIYKGTFNATTQAPDLSNAVKGHFYKIEVAGQAFGSSFSVGDMLLINDDMLGVIDANKIDKIDNGESLAQLDDLTDVALVNEVTGQILVYQNNEWVNLTLSADDFTADHTAVNYTAADPSIEGHLSGLDSELPNKADTINSIQVANGAVVIASDDIVGEHTGVHYTAADNDSMTSHLSAIDTELNNRADTINGQAVANGAVTLGSDDILGERAGTNYTALATDSITTHLSGIDADLGTIDTRIDNLTIADMTNVTLGTLADGEVLRFNGAAFVDARLSSDDVDSDHTGVNYLAAGATVTGQLAGIDSELPNKADTINGQAVVAGAVTLSGEDIAGDHVGVNYTGLAADSVKAHLQGIDGQLENVAVSVNNINAVNNNVTIDADDLASDHLAVNYTGLAAASVKAHLQGVDAELPNKADTINGQAVAGGSVTIDGDDIIAPHTGVNYTGANNDNVTEHFNLVDAKLGGIDGVIAALELDSLTDVSLTGTLSSGEVLRYSGAEWVDARLSSDDVDADHTGVNYTGANTDNVTTHLSGIDSQLGNVATSINNINAQNNNIAIDADDLPADHLAVNYAGIATDSVKTHLQGIDADLGTLDTKIDNLSLNPLADVTISATLLDGEVLRYDDNASQWVDRRLGSDDVDSEHTAVNYTQADATVTGQLSGLDSELPNKADTVNGQAVVAGAVTIDGDDLIAPHTGVNYTGLNTDTLTQHMSKVDTKLGSIDGAISALELDSLTDVSLTGTLSAGEVLRFSGAAFVDSRLSSDDVDSDHTGVNYTQADATVTGQLSGIDAQLGSVATSINNIQAQGNNIALDADDLPSDLLAVNYTGIATDSVKTHLSGIDSELGTLDTKIDNLSLNPLADVTISATLSDGEVLRYDANATQWVDDRLDSSDVDSDHTAVNYTQTDATVTGQIAGLDAELPSKADTINGQAVAGGSVTIGSDDIVGERAGTNYTALATDSITTHLSGIDSDLGTLDTRIDNLSLTSLTNVSLTGTLSSGEVLRYDGNAWVDATLSSDDVSSDHTAVNYTQADASVTGQLSGLDSELPNKADTVNGQAVANGSVTIDGSDVEASRAGVNYTAIATASLADHLQGVDTELNNRADTVNGQAVVNGAVTIEADDIVAPHTGVNYTAANTDDIKTHLAGIDSALALAVSNAGVDDLNDVTLSGTLSAGEILRYNGAGQWVDAQLDYSDLANAPALPSSSDDLTSDHTGTNYTGADGASLTAHLSGIDSEFDNRAEIVNSIAIVNGAVTIGSDDIVGERVGTNYTALATDSITTHLSGIDAKLGTTDTAISNLDVGDLASVSLTGTLSAGEVLRYSGTEWVDAQLDYSDLVNTPTIPSDSDDITGIHTGVNYTAANTDTVTTHLSAIDNKIGTLEGAGSVDDVSVASTLVRGRLYQATNTLDVTHTLPASANSEEGDKIRVYRSQSAGLVTLQQDAGDAGTIIQTAEGFVSSFVLNLQGEYVEVIYDADDSVWRTVQQRAAYIESTITTASDPYTVPRPNALYELDAAAATRINVTLPAYSRLKNGDSFRFVVNTDREVEINVAGVDSGVVDLIQAGVNNNDQIVLNALAGQPFEIKCLTSGGSDEFIVESLLGTASKFDVGTSATNIVQLDATGKLPAIDGSQLTNIAGGGGGGGGFNFDRQSVNFTATVNYHYSVSTATTAVVMTLPDLSAVGNSDQVRIYFRERGATNDITINVAAASGDLINGSASFTLDIQYESITLIANTTDSIWEVI